MVSTPYSQRDCEGWVVPDRFPTVDDPDRPNAFLASFRKPGTKRQGEFPLIQLWFELNMQALPARCTPAKGRGFPPKAEPLAGALNELWPVIFGYPEVGSLQITPSLSLKTGQSFIEVVR